MFGDFLVAQFLRLSFGLLGARRAARLPPGVPGVTGACTNRPTASRKPNRTEPVHQSTGDRFAARVAVALKETNTIRRDEFGEANFHVLGMNPSSEQQLEVEFGFIPLPMPSHHAANGGQDLNVAPAV